MSRSGRKTHSNGEAEHEGAREPRELTEFGLDDDSWIDRLRDAERTGSVGRIGPYELIAEIGRGGQGVVYKTTQPSTGRVIALKRMLGGSLADASARQRFQREVEAAAALDHEGVVTIFGLDFVDGQPLLAMEWIDGVPITDWATSHDRSRDEVIRVFIDLCDALAHAHRRGVIHRDIKPSNVLVTREGAARVLDFGLAKRTEDDARLTRTAEFLGTPAYAPPEVVLDPSTPPDVRLDVYAVGLLLYESLLGRLPYPETTPLSALLRSIREDEPIRPRSIRPAIGAELDLILMKALAKDPAHRYPTVDALQDDLVRLLAGDAVLAHPPSLAYQMKGLLRRHRVAFAFAAALLVVLAAFGAVSTYLAIDLKAQRDRAVLAELREAGERTRAVERADEANSTIAFLLDVILPNARRANDVDVRSAFEEAATSIGAAPLQPREKALRHVLSGIVFHRLARYESATYHFAAALQMRRAELGPEHIDTLRAQRWLAASTAFGGAFDEGAAQFDDVIARLRRVDEAEFDLRDALLDYANLLTARGDVSGATAKVDEALLLIVDHEPGEMDAGRAQVAIEVLKTKANLLLEKGKAADAVECLRHALVLAEAYGNDAVEAKLTGDLGFAIVATGKLEEGDAMLARAEESLERIYGEDHSRVVTALSHRADALALLGRLEEAEQRFRRAAAIASRIVGERSAERAIHLFGLANVLTRQSRLEDAARALDESTEITRETMGDRSSRVADCLALKSQIEALLEHDDEAERLLRQAIEIEEELYGNEASVLPRHLIDLAKLRGRAGEFVEQEALTRRALALYVDRYGPTHGATAYAQLELGESLARQKRFTDAVPHLQESIRGFTSIEPTDDRTLLRARFLLALCLSRTERVDEAIEILTEIEGTASSRLGEDHFMTRLVRDQLEKLTAANGEPDGHADH